MNATEIETRLKVERLFVEFNADEGRILQGEIMNGHAPEGHFPVTINWRTWYVTPDVMTRFLTVQEAISLMRSWNE